MLGDASQDGPFEARSSGGCQRDQVVVWRLLICVTVYGSSRVLEDRSRNIRAESDGSRNDPVRSPGLCQGLAVGEGLKPMFCRRALLFVQGVGERGAAAKTPGGRRRGNDLQEINLVWPGWGRQRGRASGRPVPERFRQALNHRAARECAVGARPGRTRRRAHSARRREYSCDGRSVACATLPNTRRLSQFSPRLHMTIRSVCSSGWRVKSGPGAVSRTR